MKHERLEQHPSSDVDCFGNLKDDNYDGDDEGDVGEIDSPEDEVVSHYSSCGSPTGSNEDDPNLYTDEDGKRRGAAEDKANEKQAAKTSRNYHQANSYHPRTERTRNHAKIEASKSQIVNLEAKIMRSNA